MSTKQQLAEIFYLGTLYYSNALPKDIQKKMPHTIEFFKNIRIEE